MDRHPLVDRGLGLRETCVDVLAKPRLLGEMQQKPRRLECFCSAVQAGGVRKSDTALTRPSWPVASAHFTHRAALGGDDIHQILP